MKRCLEDEMDTIDYKRLFKLIAKTESGNEQNLEDIERRLEPLRRGKALAYQDLEVIANREYWPFSKYWMWPDKSQIENKLETTAGFFKDLPNNEITIIRRLNNIFKNIALVSIILRFARPDCYAIYSWPVLQILRIERGKNAVEEYLNYIREMRILKDSFGVKKVSEVDQIVWAIFYLQGKYAVELKKILAKQLPENLSAEELIIYLSHNPLRIAREYLKRKDHITAGLWAAKAFEKFLDDECRNHGIYIGEHIGRLSCMIRELSSQIEYWNDTEKRSLLYRIKKIRNMIVHETKPLGFSEIEEIIISMETLTNITSLGNR